MTTTSAGTVDSGADQRIHALDVLRGSCLLGMIVVHFHQRVNTDAEESKG